MHKETDMNATTCTLCTMPIRPGEPAATAAALDVADGRLVLGPRRRYHVRDGCGAARTAADRARAA